MESAKPIEAGCLALIIAGRFAGKVVTVLVRVSNETAYPRQNSSDFGEWRYNIEHPIGGYFNTIERNLVRIDNPDLQKQIEAEKEKENA